MLDNSRIVIMLAGIVVFASVLLLSRNHTHEWERNAGYPFGQMCNSIFTGYADTCPRN